VWDVIVIGEGLAGLTAALRAAQRGREVLIVSEGSSSLLHASGALNLGDFAQLAQLPGHPYQIVGRHVLDRAVAFFQDICPGYAGDSGAAKPVLTPLGTVRLAELLPRAFQATPLQTAKRIILLAPQGLRDFFPDVIRVNLGQAFSSARVEVKELALPSFRSWQEQGLGIAPMVYQRYWASAEGRAAIERLRRDLAAEGVAGFGETVAVFPGLAPDLDREPPGDEAGAKDLLPMVLMPSFPPAPAGAALAAALERRFLRSGGELWRGSRVVGAVLGSSGSYCAGIIVRSKGKDISLRARSFILASGGILGGGIVVGPARSAEETVFGLPLYAPADWTRPDFLGTQPFAQTGVSVDPELRPLDPYSRARLLTNVRVAGRTLAHWDPWTEHCGGGVSLATGYLAGELA